MSVLRFLFCHSSNFSDGFLNSARPLIVLLADLKTRTNPEGIPKKTNACWCYGDNYLSAFVFASICSSPSYLLPTYYRLAILLLPRSYFMPKKSLLDLLLA